MTEFELKKFTRKVQQHINKPAVKTVSELKDWIFEIIKSKEQKEKK